MIFRIIISLLLLSIVPSAAMAEELSYACKVIRVYELDRDGTLRTSNWDQQFKGSEFIISRVTGEISGKVVPTFLAHSTKIINKGSKEYSFKAIADFEKQVQLIEVQEFVRKREKPFIVISMGGAGIVTGLCE